MTEIETVGKLLLQFNQLYAAIKTRAPHATEQEVIKEAEKIITAVAQSLRKNKAIFSVKESGPGKIKLACLKIVQEEKEI